ncbi:MFS transporter [Rhodococcus sovatensis]|uniref:MFS transporter n=1 Tax=Rhodococcus sovatensis TaxID=1805840 RepID=A0ABZ2PIN5_9NOCA
MSTDNPTTPSPQVVRRASTAGFLGTVVEAYDFLVYVFLIAYTAPLFFPSDDPVTGTLASLAVLGTGFLARPLGGLFFGQLGDRRGRRFTLMITIVGMGATTTLIGLLPTYATIGVFAPVLLVILRLLQGFSAGGELIGSTTFVSEHAGKNNHGKLSAVTPIGFAVGSSLAPGVVALLTFLLSEGSMADWGWRVPLLLSLPMTATCLILRLRLEDSPEYRRIVSEKKVPKAPLKELFSNHARTLARVIVLSASVLMIGYIAAAYLPVFLRQEVGMKPGTAAAVASLGSAIGISASIGAAFIVDRLGRKRTLILLMGILGVTILPVMYVMKATGGNFGVTVLTFALIAGIAGAAAVPAYAAFTALFPAGVRFSGAAIGFGIGSALGGGFGPYLAGQFTAWTGNPFAPAFLVIVAAIVGVAVMVPVPSRGVADDTGRIDGKLVDKGTKTRPEPDAHTADRVR